MKINLVIYFLFFLIPVFSQIDSGEYIGNSAVLLLRGDNYYHLMSAGVTKHRAGQYTVAGDTLTLKTRLVKDPEIEHTTRFVRQSKTLVFFTERYENVVNKSDSVRTRRISNLVYKHHGLQIFGEFQKSAASWNFIFYTPDSLDYKERKLEKITFDMSDGLPFSTIEKIKEKIDVKNGRSVHNSKSGIARMFADVYLVDGYALNMVQAMPASKRGFLDLHLSYRRQQNEQ